VALTIDAERLVFSRRATVGTATEIAHHLAVLLASQGERKCLECGAPMVRGPEWVCTGCGARAPLASARHFSPSTYAAACQKCNGVGTLQVPNPAKLIIHPEKPLVEGAMYSPGFFPNGYLGKPFNGGYYLLQALAEHYGFDPHKTPWDEISAEAQQAFLFGSQIDLTVTYQTGRRSNTYGEFPGFYGFIHDWDVGGTYSDTRPCPACGGARLRPEYLAVKLSGHSVYELERMTLVELAERLAGIVPARRELASALDTVRQRLRFLIQVGLGYVNLERVAGTLSAGEAQRIRLASLLGSGLTALTVLLDEPTRGLHPAEVEALISALEALRDAGNTVIVVEHDPQVMRSADNLIDMGPGAGQNGGQVVAHGMPEEVARGDSYTGRWLRGERRMQTRNRREPQGWLRIRGAHANNLKGETIEFPLRVLVGVCGVSGSGKSTLVADTLGRALAPKKQTTSVAYEPVQPGEYTAIEGAPPRTLVVDQSKAGLLSPATFLDLIRPIQAIYAASPEAQVRGLSEARLAERCSVCDGRGRLTLDMAFLPDVHVTCETCRGSGYTAEAWEVHLNGLALPDVFGRTIDEVYRLFGYDPRLGRSLQAAQEVGLGYLVLRQPGYALSGGEAQRLKIAGELRRKSVAGSLYILDEPSIGQHLEDVLRLTGVLHRLVAEGGSVLVVEHHTHLLAACDWLLELGPGGGPGGGHVIAPHTGTGGSLEHADCAVSARVTMSWLPLLLADPSACLRWLVLRDLFGRPAGDPELAELADLRQHDPLVTDLLGLQEADGSWRTGVLSAAGRTGNRALMTAFALARLGYLGFDATHPAVRAGAEYLFSQLQADGSWPLAENSRVDRREQRAAGGRALLDDPTANRFPTARVGSLRLRDRPARRAGIRMAAGPAAGRRRLANGDSSGGIWVCCRVPEAEGFALGLPLEYNRDADVPGAAPGPAYERTSPAGVEYAAGTRDARADQPGAGGCAPGWS
jgi:excinuclease ABC subunit A